MIPLFIFVIFFFNDTATTEIYTLSLHDALPICPGLDGSRRHDRQRGGGVDVFSATQPACSHGWLCPLRDRKSTRLNSSHQIISYAVFCLKKKKLKRTVLNSWPQCSLHRSYWQTG